jgi:hypothetical protein
VSPSLRQSLVFAATLAIPLASAAFVLSMRRGVSPVTIGLILGVLGTLCIVAIGFAIRNVRRSEEKRKAKLHIWMKH